MALYWKVGICVDFLFLFFDAEITFVKFWDFQTSSDYMLACQRSTVQARILSYHEGK